jgi:uncharacterized protein (TIGR00106 family)
MIVADFSMVPMGSGTSASTYIKAVHDLLRELDVKFVPEPMSTAVETESFEELFEIIEKANKRLKEIGVQRIITSIKIDYRLDKEISIESKLRVDPKMTNPSRKSCPFIVGRACLMKDCMAWREEDCNLIRQAGESLTPFEHKLRNAAPLMYRSLLDLVRIMEDTSKGCGKCGPDLWNYVQEVRSNLLDELIKSELAEVGITGY